MIIKAKVVSAIRPFERATFQNIVVQEYGFGVLPTNLYSVVNYLKRVVGVED